MRVAHTWHVDTPVIGLFEALLAFVLLLLALHLTGGVAD
jgi:hypothetical protein